MTTAQPNSTVSSPLRDPVVISSKVHLVSPTLSDVVLFPRHGRDVLITVWPERIRPLVNRSDNHDVHKGHLLTNVLLRTGSSLAAGIAGAGFVVAMYASIKSGSALLGENAVFHGLSFAGIVAGAAVGYLALGAAYYLQARYRSGMLSRNAEQQRLNSLYRLAEVLPALEKEFRSPLPRIADTAQAAVDNLMLEIMAAQFASAFRRDAVRLFAVVADFAEQMQAYAPEQLRACISDERRQELAEQLRDAARLIINGVVKVQEFVNELPETERRPFYERLGTFADEKSFADSLGRIETSANNLLRHAAALAPEK